MEGQAALFSRLAHFDMHQNFHEVHSISGTAMPYDKLKWVIQTQQALSA